MSDNYVVAVYSSSDEEKKNPLYEARVTTQYPKMKGVLPPRRITFTLISTEGEEVAKKALPLWKRIRLRLA